MLLFHIIVMLLKNHSCCFRVKHVCCFILFYRAVWADSVKIFFHSCCFSENMMLQIMQQSMFAVSVFFCCFRLCYRVVLLIQFRAVLLSRVLKSNVFAYVRHFCCISDAKEQPCCLDIDVKHFCSFSRASLIFQIMIKSIFAFLCLVICLDT